MFREVEENRYIIRRYIRSLSVSKDISSHDVQDLDQAMAFFIILHNSLKLEDMYYDQVMMQGKEINKYLSLTPSFRATEIIGSFYKLYREGSRVRNGLEGISRVEEIRIILNANKHLYKKLSL